jgi:hypothetical protein
MRHQHAIEGRGKGSPTEGREADGAITLRLNEPASLPLIRGSIPYVVEPMARVNRGRK